MLTDPKKILSALQKKAFTEKKINAYLKKCLKKLSFGSATDLANLSGLARWLYIFGYEEDALQVTGIINDIEFKGNFNLWSRIEVLLLLQARILRMRGELANAKAARKKVSDAMADHEEALRRRLSFNWLNDASIARYTKQGNEREANVGRFADLSNLIFISELGEGKTDLDNKPADVTGAEKRITEYLAILASAK